MQPAGPEGWALRGRHVVPGGAGFCSWSQGLTSCPWAAYLATVNTAFLQMFLLFLGVKELLVTLQAACVRVPVAPEISRLIQGPKPQRR